MKFISTIILCFFLTISIAQEAETFTIEQIIELAQSESPQVKLAELKQSNAYWNNQSFLANYRPQIDLGITLPSLNRSVGQIDLPDGTSDFIARSFMTNSISLSLSQNVTATGGSVYAAANLSRLDVFKTDNNPSQVTYRSNPLIFGFNQPLFGFNQLKWDKRIMPLEYEEAQARFSEEMEATAMLSVGRFFELLIAQLNLKSALSRKVVADDLYQLGQNRFSVGNIAETDLLQLEMDVMRSNTDISRAKLAKQTANEELRNFLGILESVDFQLDLPLDIPDITVDMELALLHARSNRSTIMALQIRLLEAEQFRERSKANAGISGSLTGEIGLTGLGSGFSDAYSTLLDQQIVSLRLNIPIADWGKSKASHEIAKSNYDLVNLNVGLEKVNFENAVRISVQQFELIKENVNLSKRSYEASQKRYDLTRKRYVIGKVDVTQLNLADIEQEGQRRSYIQSINDFWQKYYEIRSLTLYDFINGKSLVETNN